MKRNICDLHKIVNFSVKDYILPIRGIEEKWLTLEKDRQNHYIASLKVYGNWNILSQRLITMQNKLEELHRKGVSEEQLSAVVSSVEEINYEAYNSQEGGGAFAHVWGDGDDEPSITNEDYLKDAENELYWLSRYCSLDPKWTEPLLTAGDICLKKATNNQYSGRDATYYFICDNEIEIVDNTQSPGKYVAYTGYFGSYVVRVYTNGTMRGCYIMEPFKDSVYNLSLEGHDCNVSLKSDAITSLEFHRRNKKLTRTKLGEQADVKARTIEQYEQRRRNINNAPVSLIFKLAKALGVTIDDLIDSEHRDECFNEEDYE
jgi:DNA-binding XRE family transcriptional regulator